MLAAGDGFIVWVGSKLPSAGTRLVTRLGLGATHLIRTGVMWVGGALVTVLSAPIVIKGAIVFGTLVIIGSVVYFVLPSGEVISISEDDTSYGVAVQTVEDFDGADVLLMPVVGELDEFIAAHRRDTGYIVSFPLGVHPTREEATQALCDTIAAGSVTENPGGTRSAQFSFAGRSYGLPVNPCD